jgi:hypothetical protein
MQFEYTLLVPAGSSIRRFSDADRGGVRIAAVRNHASTNALTPLLKQAQLVYADTPDPTFGLLRDGQADVMASVRDDRSPCQRRKLRAPESVAVRTQFIRNSVGVAP